MTQLIYKGTGPGTRNDRLFRRAPGGKAVTPVRPAVQGRLAFPHLNRNGDSLSCVAIEPGHARLIGIDLRLPDAKPFTYWNNDRHAIYYPALSPGGQYVAYLSTPNRHYPPQRGDSAQLRILRREEREWRRLGIDETVRLAPLEWGFDENTVFATDTGGALIGIHAKRGKAATTVAAAGSHPSMAPDGAGLAYLTPDQRIAVTGPAAQQITPTGPVTALGWSADGASLLYAVQGGYWASAVYRHPLFEETAPSVAFKTGEISFIAESPL